MFSRFLVTGLMIVLLAACGGNGDNGDNGANGTNGDDAASEEEAAEERRGFTVSVTGDTEDEFSSGYFALCDVIDEDTGEHEFITMSMGSMAFIMFLNLPQGVLESGLGTYQIADAAPEQNEVGMNFELDERSYNVTGGEITLEAFPENPGDLFIASVTAQASHTELGDINIEASVRVPVSGENTLTNCFGS